MEVVLGEYGEEKVSKLINLIYNGYCEEIARRNVKLEEGSRIFLFFLVWCFFLLFFYNVYCVLN